MEYQEKKLSVFESLTADLSGHTADSCTNPTPSEPQNDISCHSPSLPQLPASTSLSGTSSSPLLSSEPLSNNLSISDQTNAESPSNPTLPHSSHGQKRAISSDSNVDTPSQLSPTESPLPTDNQMPPPPSYKTSHNTTKPCKKKPKTLVTENPKLTLNSQISIQNLYKNNPSNLTLSEIQLTAFLENSHGSSDPLNDALEFTTNIQGLLNDLSLLYAETKERSLKNRLTRLQKKLKRQLNPEDLSDNKSVSSDNQTDDEHPKLLTP
ncbi:uncharacterized protein LOC130444390 [Diorhabda sublineata]|uniref:uncharacterized protein LOC130444390 n=1 Tax=Diorhabda sublineata TaxID=1163346 RepID=UPI0024E093D2|nr:uncharacterized protein LOC130444390 [Diorhabda sublineata]